MDEIAIILKEEKFNHVIVIDDARMYLGIDGYPSIRTLRKYIQKICPNYEIRILEELIKIYNPRIHDHDHDLPWH